MPLNADSDLIMSAYYKKESNAVAIKNVEYCSTPKQTVKIKI